MVLGVLLVSITIARGRFVRQRAVAEQKLAAAAAVDVMVGKWMAGDSAAIPISAGRLEGMPNHIWRTRVLEKRLDLNASIVRLEVVNQSNNPVITLDLLRHNERPSTRPTRAP